jgi:hypothetical protein
MAGQSALPMGGSNGRQDERNSPTLFTVQMASHFDPALAYCREKDIERFSGERSGRHSRPPRFSPNLQRQVMAT